MGQTYVYNSGEALPPVDELHKGSMSPIFHKKGYPLEKIKVYI